MFPGGDGTTISNEDLELDEIVFEGNGARHNLLYLMFKHIVFKFEAECDMNIFDDHEGNNQEDKIGANWQHNANKEEFDLGKCQGIFATC